MKIKNIKKIVFPLIVILIILLLIFSLTSCYPEKDISKNTISEQLSNLLDEAETEHNSEQDFFTDDSSSGSPPFGSQVIDGLHVTGTPIEIDIEKYRLKVTGLVEKELSLTYQEVRSIPSSRIFAVLECPGYFVDEGYWTGVRVMDILNEAGIKAEAKNVVFSDVSDSYASTLPLERITSGEILVAYLFNDKEFPVVHGFPLRIVAGEEEGNVWVKWLGTIKVIE